jgi:predicted DNA-binding WGR domain protein
MSSTRLTFKEGTSDKFWQIDLSGANTTVTYGKSGSKGQSQTKNHGTPAKAKAFYDKSIAEKTKKGYAADKAAKRKTADDDDVKAPAKRSRGAAKEPSEDEKEEEEEEDADDDDDSDGDSDDNGGDQPVPPLRFELDLGGFGFGLYADAKVVVAGTESGVVVECSHSATELKVLRKFQLGSGVKAIVKDGSFLYCGTLDGELIDLTQDAPRVMCKVEDFEDIYWIDVYEGCVAASSEQGDLVFVNGEGEILWRVNASDWSSGDASAAWACRVDATGVYLGHGAGVAKYALKDGKRLWVNTDVNQILFGVHTASSFFVTGEPEVTAKIDKKTGKTQQRYDSSSPSCAVDEQGSTVVVANRGYDAKNGKLIWHFADDGMGGASAALVGNKLFTIADRLLMFDVSPAAVKKANAGDPGKSKSGSATKQKAVAISNTVESTSDRSKGVEVECVKDGSKLRIRAVSAGFDSALNVQFPRDLRVAGAHFMCDDLVPSKAGDFYRAVGAIRRLK